MNHRLMACACVAAMLGAAAPGLAQSLDDAAKPPAPEPRILTQLGLGLGLSLNLLLNEMGIVNNNDVTPPKCKKLVSLGSVETLSVVASSPTQRTSKIDAYFDDACTKPYVEASVQVTIDTSTETATFVETATFLQQNGKPFGTLNITDVLSVTKGIETQRGLGKFTPVGGAPVADVGFTCSIPDTGTAKVAHCQGGVAQTFRSLNRSLASVFAFTITAATNTAATSVKLAASSANLRTGPAGSLSITAPTPQTLGIGGGGTAYGTATMTGSEARFALFPPEPTQWRFTDKAHNAVFAYHIASNTTRDARATVSTISPVKGMALMTLDRSGTGTLKYGDGRVAAVRGYLAGD